MIKVVKRDGKKVRFEAGKIEDAISKAFKAFESKQIENNEPVIHVAEEEITNIVDSVVLKVQGLGIQVVDIETIQDIVQKAINDFGYFEVAELYISYRTERTVKRKEKEESYRTVAKVMKATDRENANVGNGPSGKLLQTAEALGKDYVMSFLTPKGIREVIEKKLLYRHDESWMIAGTTTCTFIPLRKLLLNGFNTGHGFTRSSKRIKTACQHACIIFQSNQNDQHGGQAFGFFDRDMAEFIKREYDYQLMDLIVTSVLSGLLTVEGIDFEEDMALLEKIDDLTEEVYFKFKKKYEKIFDTLSSEEQERMKKVAWVKTRIETYQAMEGLVANLNTMHSRAGAQVPFTSINFGTDTSKEGRLVMEMLLKAYEKGLGNGEQPIFPNLIFKIREGISWLGDVNEDLLRLSVRVTAKRLFPNFVFMDCTLNKDFPTDVPVMGCRTRVGWDVTLPMDKQTVEGRGNASFSTVGNVEIAIQSKYYIKYTALISKKFLELAQKYNIAIPSVFAEERSIETFFVKLNEIIDIGFEQLKDRLFNVQGKFTKADFPFLMNGVWLDSENLEKNDTVLEVIKHGSLSIGFLGLAETLKCLVGYHHGENAYADLLGEQIVKFMRAKCDEQTEKDKLNYSLLATPKQTWVA